MRTTVLARCAMFLLSALALFYCQFPPPAFALDGNDLVAAASRGDLAGVRKVVDGGVNVNARDKTGFTGLMAASKAGHVEIVKFLVEKGAYAGSKAPGGKTAVSLAEESGNAEIAEFLKKSMSEAKVMTSPEPAAQAKPAPEEARPAETASAPAPAAEKPPEPARPAPASGSDPTSADFLKAVESGDTGRISSALEVGASVNSKDANGDTALMIAINKNNKALVRMLIEKGADVNAKNLAGSGALFKAIITGEAEIVKMLLDRGADPNTVNSHGESALMIAARKGNVEMITNLIDKGAQVNYMCENESLAGNYQYETDDESTGAYENNPSSRTNEEYALSYAVDSNKLEAARTLIKNGAYTTVSCGGKPALIHAINSRFADMAKLLVECGADVNSVDGGGAGALVCAVKTDQIDIVRLIAFKVHDFSDALYLMDEKGGEYREIADSLRKRDAERQKEKKAVDGD